jgi:hypothetical protein
MNSKNISAVYVKLTKFLSVLEYFDPYLVSYFYSLKFETRQSNLVTVQTQNGIWAFSHHLQPCTSPFVKFG